jgi:hypothetical protein
VGVARAEFQQLEQAAAEAGRLRERLAQTVVVAQLT